MISVAFALCKRKLWYNTQRMVLESKMSKHSKKHRKVMIVLRLSGTAGRDILSGIFLFTKQHLHWHTRIFQMPGELTPEIFAALEADGYDGVIASEPGPDETARLLAKSKLPISFIGDPGPILARRKSGMTYIRNDDEYIGRLGARYLASLGNFRTYAFIPTASSQYWSNLRFKGFSDEMFARKQDVLYFRSPSTAGSNEDLAALKTWLTKLPKPAAVMASWDTRATQAVQLCEEAGIKIPRQLAILGVDNDELLDESTNPPLTSILPDHEKLGFVAARELERLINGRSAKSDVAFLARPLRIVERESAVATAPAAHIVTRAADYIRKNATKGITPDDVAEFLGISRRLADLRFSQFGGETINEAITRTRLDAIKKLLATTNRPIKAIAESCGYDDPSWIKVLFKRRFGMTMRDWRAHQCANIRQNLKPTPLTAKPVL